MTLLVYHLQLESGIQKMEPMSIAVTVGFSLIVVGCFVAVVQRCKKPTMKPSRSDGDLTTLVDDKTTPEAFAAQYA